MSYKKLLDAFAEPPSKSPPGECRFMCNYKSADPSFEVSNPTPTADGGWRQVMKCRTSLIVARHLLNGYEATVEKLITDVNGNIRYKAVSNAYDLTDMDKFYDNMRELC